MTIIKQFERLLLINRRLHALDIPVVCTLHIDSNSSFLVLSHIYVDKKAFGTGINDSIKSIVEEAITLAKPTYTQVKQICFDMLATQFYLDKEEVVTVESINSEGVLLSTGETVEHTRLFIKE